mgnify:CR=1 FL=1
MDGSSGGFFILHFKIIIMNTLDKNSETMQSLLITDFRQNNSSSEEIQTAITPQYRELYTTGQESLLFKMYDLEEEDLFV